jgi:predicted HD phosphohydrolase
LEHALQSAALAEANQASPSLITASLLHDIGYFLPHLKKTYPDLVIDKRHEHSGADFLKAFFGEEVTEPVRLHVPAKRYLCQVDPEYYDTLSAISKQTLEIQGGIFSPEEAEAFIDLPFAKEAVKLRIWDDLAKVKGAITPDLSHFAIYMEQSLKK